MLITKLQGIHGQSYLRGILSLHPSWMRKESANYQLEKKKFLVASEVSLELTKIKDLN